MISSSMRSSTPWHCLSDPSIFSNTSVLLNTKAVHGLVFRVHLLWRCGCRYLKVLWPRTSTSASRCCSSAFASSSSTSSPCRLWPGLSANFTRFESRSSVFRFRLLSNLNLRIHSPDTWELVGPLVRPHGRSAHSRPSPLWLLDAELQQSSGTMSSPVRSRYLSS